MSSAAQGMRRCSPIIVRTCAWRNSFHALRSLSSTHQPEIRGTLPMGGVGVVIDQYAEAKRIYTQEDVNSYGQLVGDMNPLHQRWSKSEIPSNVEHHPLLAWDDDDEESTKPIVHGMLVSGLFSCIFGSLIPGAVYLKQSLDFRKPVYVDILVVARVTVTAVRQTRRKGLIVTCDTHVFSQDQECVRGEANVWIPVSKEQL